MLDQVLSLFQIKPDIDLNVIKKDQELSLLNSILLKKINIILKKFKPNVTIVQGDTTTAFVSSLACFYLGLNVAHVEAGLRTNNILSPFPEEFNRQITSKIAKLHFAPTIINKRNLLNEGVLSKKIFITGNTVIDSLKIIMSKINKKKKKKKLIINNLNKLLGFNILKNRYVLITGHRRENFGKNFLDICHSIKTLSKKYKKINFIYPVHLNPNVQKPVKKILNKIKNIKLISPQNYENFLTLMKYSYFILSDSGGIQEEAPSFNKPVLVMRNETERLESKNFKSLKLIGPDKKKIINNVSLLLNDKSTYNKMINKKNPYGNGNAAKIISKYLLRHI